MSTLMTLVCITIVISNVIINEGFKITDVVTITFAKLIAITISTIIKDIINSAQSDLQSVKTSVLASSHFQAFIENLAKLNSPKTVQKTRPIKQVKNYQPQITKILEAPTAKNSGSIQIDTPQFNQLPKNQNQSLFKLGKQPSKKRDLLQTSVVNTRQSKPFKNLIQKKKIKLEEFLFERVNKGSMLLKIEQIITKQQLIAKLKSGIKKKINHHVDTGSQNLEIKMNVLKISKQFFENFYPVKAALLSGGSFELVSNLKSSKEDINSQVSSNQASRHRNKYQDYLNMKIFEPFYISNTMKLQYQDGQDQKFSTVDIISKFFYQKKESLKLYLKVKLSDLDEASICKSELNSQSIQTSLKNQSLINIMQKEGYNSDSQELEKGSSVSQNRKKHSHFEQADIFNREKLGSLKLASNKFNKADFNPQVNVKVNFEFTSLKSDKVILTQSLPENKEISQLEESKIQSQEILAMNSREIYKNILSSDSLSANDSDEEEQMEGGSVESGPIQRGKSFKNNMQFLNLNFEEERKQMKEDYSKLKEPRYMSRLYQDHKERTRHMNEDDDLYRYYEFELKQVDGIEEFKEFSDLTYINIQDITTIIRGIQKMTDTKYMDAIEANYSHEQMTPLNCIIGNSRIAAKRLNTIVNQKINDFGKLKDTSLLIKAVEQSGQIMQLYNENQIQRMKIKRQKFKPVLTSSKSPEKYLKEVFAPFEPYILQKGLNIYFARRNTFDHEISLDWRMYQLVAFNMIQNAIKYNDFQGDIMIILTCKQMQFDENDESEESIDFRKGQYSPQKKECLAVRNLLDSKVQMLSSFNQKYILETEIFDTGIGIPAEKQKFLFVPFSELKQKQNFHQVENFTTGMGLACSLAISAALGGDLTLKKREKPTVFGFKIPVMIEEEDVDKVSNKSFVEDPGIKIEQYYGTKRTMSKLLDEAFRQEFNLINSISIEKGLSSLNFNGQSENSNLSGTIQSLSFSQSQSFNKKQCQEQGIQNSQSHKQEVQKISDSNSPSSQQIDEEEKEEESDNSQIVQQPIVPPAESQKANQKLRVAHPRSSKLLQLKQISRQNEISKEQKIKIAKGLLLENNVNGLINEASQMSEEDIIQLNGSFSSAQLSSYDEIRVNNDNQVLQNSGSSGFEILNRQRDRNQVRADQSNDEFVFEEEIKEGSERDKSLDDSDSFDYVRDKQIKQYKRVSDKKKIQISDIELGQSSGRLEEEEKHSSELQKFQVIRSMSSSPQSSNVKCSCTPSIMIVDDNLFNIMPLKTLIEEEFKIFPELADNGQKAVDIYKERFKRPCRCKNRVFKLIIMDVQMPVMNGIQASRQIFRIQGEERLTNIVALTSYTDEQTIGTLRQMDVKKVYNKPMHYEFLHECMHLYFKDMDPEEYKAMAQEKFKK